VALRFLREVVALAVFATIVEGSAGEQTFRSGADTVLVYATVRDSSGRLVTGLSRDDFRLRHDGRPARIDVFSTDAQPLSVAVMLDTSQGHDARRGEGALAFIDALRPEDRASLGTFGFEIAVGAQLTRDRGEFQRVLSEETWGGGGTPLWQAIGAACSSLAGRAGRRAVLVLTDGKDSGSIPGLPGGREAIEAQVLRQGCMVYAVLVASSQQMSRDVVRFVDSTGGGHATVAAEEDMALGFQRIAEELRHQYLIGFNPPAIDGRVHSIELLAGPNMSVQARQRYLAELPQ
jgi:VWFA-related protein